jgi:hypothetical protein
VLNVLVFECIGVVVHGLEFMGMEFMGIGVYGHWSSWALEFMGIGVHWIHGHYWREVEMHGWG